MENQHRNQKKSDRYFLALVIIAGLGIILGLKDIAVLVVMLTLGLGFPFLFATTVFIYLLCFLPIVLFWDKRSLRPIVCLTSVIALAAVACLPSYFSNKKADAYAARVAAYQIKPAPNQTFRTVEIQQYSNSISQFNNGDSSRDGCNDVCASLLENGEVDWVRIEQRNPNYPKDEKGDATLYAPGSGDACHIPGGSNEPPQHCVLVQADDSRKADVVLILAAGYSDGLSVGKDTRGTPARGWRRITAFAGADTEYRRPLMRMHEQNYEKVRLPTIIEPAFSGMSSGGYELLHYTIKLAPLDLISALRSLGFKVNIAPKPVLDPKKQSWQGEPTDADILAAISVLNLQSSDPFSQAENGSLNQWVMHARNYKDWNTYRLDIATRIFRDPRAGFIGFFDQVFRHPEVAKILLPMALAEVQNSDISKPREALKSVLWAIPQVDADILKANLPQIISIVQTNKFGKFDRSFIYALSLAGENPLPYLSKLGSENLITTRIKAVCLAQPVGGSAYITQLRHELDGQGLGGEWPDDIVKHALYALVIHSDDAFVQDIVGKSQWRTKDRMMADMIRNRDDKRNPISNKCRD
jgi:hypothetical protein